MARRSSAIVALGLLAWPVTSARPQSVSGRVVDAGSGQPLPGSQVLIERAGAEIRRSLTDSSGSFSISLSGLRGRGFTLRVRRIGYRWAGHDLNVDSTIANLSLDIALERRPVELDEVIVPGTPHESRLRSTGFFDRARLGFGHFVTEKQVHARSPQRVSDVLRGVPGVTIAPSNRRSGAYEVYFARAQGRLSGGRCPPRVFLDGIITGTDFDDYLIPDDLAGIEIYAGPSETPAAFGGADAACGVIVIWTK